jgi:hypothetical protein
MGYSLTYDTLFSVNGVVNTGNSVIDNLNRLATSCGCFLTFDTNNGLWSIIINRSEPSAMSFNDSNIIGGISITGSGLKDLYNSVSMEYKNAYIKGQTDYIDYYIPYVFDYINPSPFARYQGEQDKELKLNFEFITSQLQAQYVGVTELLQSRMDKIIEFDADFSAIGLKAGVIIDVNNTALGYINHKFRVTKVEEIDQDDGSIIVRITGLEHTDKIYNTGLLVQKQRDKITGILPRDLNDELNQDDAYGSIYNSDILSYDVVIGDTMIGDMENHLVDLGYNITAPFTGSYKVECEVTVTNVTLTLNNYAIGQYRSIQMTPMLNNSVYPPKKSGGNSKDYFNIRMPTSYNLSYVFNAVKGDKIDIVIQYKTDWTEKWVERLTEYGSTLPYNTPTLSQRGKLYTVTSLSVIGDTIE